MLIGFFFAVVIVGFGLIAWRGDRLRSPGGIDAPLGREGAFLLNNVLFVGFAFVVLLGTLYPLLYEAVTQQQVTVGAPFFNTVAIPVGLTLLFLMAVAPVLSWRKINGAVLWQRLAIPVWIGVGTVVLCVAFGLRGIATLIGFGLGAMAAATAARALVLSVRAAHTRHVGWWRGLVGRANGGMIVHLGVVLLAVGVIAATSYRHQAELALHQGTVVTYDGHRFEFEGLRTVTSPSRTSQEALVKVDGAVFAPATTSFGSALSVVGTPAIDSGLFGDVYLTFDAVGGLGASSGNQAINNLPQGSVAIGVVIEPLVAWLWAGGLLIGVGGLAGPGPGVPAPGHRPGVGLLGSGDGRRRRRAPTRVSGTRRPSRWARSWPGAPRARHEPAPRATPPAGWRAPSCSSSSWSASSWPPGRPRRPPPSRARCSAGRRPEFTGTDLDHGRAGLAGLAARPLRRGQLLRQLVHPVPGGGTRPLPLPLRADARGRRRRHGQRGVPRHDVHGARIPAEERRPLARRQRPRRRHRRALRGHRARRPRSSSTRPAGSPPCSSARPRRRTSTRS